MKSGVVVLTILLALAASHATTQSRPNVVLIYADDLGYGDVSAYGARRLKTPNIDRLAREGIRFRDAHAPAATCTPSRYAMLTGEYAWRKAGTGILPGNAALIVEPGRTSLASVFQRAGYATGVVGKWHLGLGPAGGPNWNGEIRPGPTDIGFDSAFVMAATGDRVPTVYVENRHVVGLDPADPITVSYGEPLADSPTGRGNPNLLKLHPSHGHDQTIVNGISRIGYMTGGKAALWKDEEMADVFTRKATAFIEQHRGKPFFLYFAPHDPHVPRVPHPRFAGATPMGPRGDAIAQLDWSVGEVLSTLDRLKLAEDTLVLFTSDNGPVIDDGYRDEAVEKLGDHAPAAPFRGGKYSNFEGGTRVPFVVRWPARVKPAVSDALVSQVDLIASFAALVGPPLSDPRARDSENVLPALLGTSKTARGVLVEQAGSLSLRQGHWKYIAPSQGPRIQQNTNTELGNDPGPQLYDLAADEGERNNLATTRPEKVRELAAILNGIRRAGARQARRPNIVLAIADDWSFPHAGIYGDPTVSTPNVDRVAREGARFTHAFVAAPSCTPSRAALLTGQAVHRLEEGGNLHGFLPKSYPVYPDLLEEAGYVVGYTGKGWGPGRFEPGGRARNPAGSLFKSFDEFMQRRAKGSPFCFWFGSTDPHRPYEPGTGAQSGMNLERVQVPRFLSDTVGVRNERERHANVRRGDLSYPVRAIRMNDYLYIRNFRADRWPAGDPQQSSVSPIAPGGIRGSTWRW